jgi:hypothetical protein
MSHQRAQRKSEAQGKKRDPNFIVKCWHCLRVILPRRHGRRHIDERSHFFSTTSVRSFPAREREINSFVSSLWLYSQSVFQHRTR